MTALAKKAGVSRSIIVRIEGESVMSPRWLTLVQVFEALEFPLWLAIMLEQTKEDPKTKFFYGIEETYRPLE